MWDNDDLGVIREYKWEPASYNLINTAACKTIWYHVEGGGFVPIRKLQTILWINLVKNSTNPL